MKTYSIDEVAANGFWYVPGRGEKDAEDKVRHFPVLSQNDEFFKVEGGVSLSKRDLSIKGFTIDKYGTYFLTEKAAWDWVVDRAEQWAEIHEKSVNIWRDRARAVVR